MSAIETSAERCEAEAPRNGSLERYNEDFADALTRFWQGDDPADALRGLLSREVIWHDSLLPGDDLRGTCQVQALVVTLRSALPDLQLSLQLPLAVGEGGVVLGYWRARGTHTAPLGPSLPPSDAEVEWEGSVLVRTVPVGVGQVADTGDAFIGPSEDCAVARQGVEVWWSWDPAFLFRQLGWQPHQQRAQVTTEGTVDEGATTAAVSGTSSADDGASGNNDLAVRTAEAAAKAHATEVAAVEAAKAAIAAAAAAAARLGESAESLAAAQAANRAVVELYFHTYNTGRYAVLDHIVHPDYKYDGLLDLGERRGRDAMAAMMGGWRDCLPDLVIGHELFAAVGPDKVTFRWVIRGTHSTPGSQLLGVAAGGARLHVMGVTTLTLREGRIARKISHANAVQTLQQLGAAVHPVIPLAPLLP